jgi:DNA-binding response OmpR family regulator
VRPSILVVDDEPTLADALAEFLRDEGYRAAIARNGLTAFELAVRSPPDLILTDVHMPRLDGIGLVRRLRATGYAVPVVVMSAVYADIGVPGVRFVVKPFDLDHLLAVVRDVLDDGASARGPG